MSSQRCRIRFAIALLGTGLVGSSSATSLHLDFAPPTSFNDFNPRAILEWDAEAGKTYVIQSADEITPTADWKNEDVAMQRSVGPVRWMAPEALRNKKYYRLVLPRPEVHSIEPAFVNSDDTNALLYLVGQGLPTNATVVVNGQSFNPTAADSNGTWVAISIESLPVGTSVTGAVQVLDSGSNVVAQLPVDDPIFYGTEPTPEQLQGPPEEPPASPQSSSGWRLWNKRKFAAQELSDKEGSRGRQAPAAVPRAAGLRHAVFLATGEVRCQETDLAIAGRGLDFVWGLTYRSRTGPTTATGHGWDFSYNISLSPQPDGTVQLRSGNGRTDTFYPDGSNGWVRDEWFVEVRDLNADGFPDVLFADGGKWLFHPDGTPLRGKISQIVDRNGNTIRCEYDDATAQLVRVVDTLDRTNTISYNPAGLIESVTDFSGRTVRYEYDGNGDLTACISPAVTGTPNKNDFPGGKTNRFTYTSGFADERLNHNLTSCVDGKGQTWLQIAYQTNQNPASLDFDAVASVLRGIEKSDIRRGQVLASPGSVTPQREYAIVNDAVGNVSEYYYDSRHRLVTLRQFTGRADPRQPTTETENRPTGKLRPGDPDSFETTFAWNADSLCTRVVYPRGNSTEMVYERAFNQNASRSNKRHAGDLRVLRELACCNQDDDGDGVLDELRWTYEYDPRFGSPLNGIADWNVGDWAIFNGSVCGPVLGAKAEFTDGRYVLRPGVPLRGSAYSTSAYNLSFAPAQGEHGMLLFEDLWPCGGDLDFNDVVLRYAAHSTDPRGVATTFEYDSSGNCRRIRKRPDLLTQEWDTLIDYNSHGQVTTITNEADANGLRRVDTIEYYTSGPQAGFLQSIAIDEPGVQLTSKYEYDARGNVTRIIDPGTNDWLFTYNQLDQCIRAESAGVTDVLPPIRIATDYFYDENNNLVRVDLDNRDDTGKLDGANPQWTTQYEYDSLKRLTQVATEVEESAVGSHYVTNRYSYDGNDNVVVVQSPLAVSGSDPDNVVAMEYDERDLLYRSIPAPGTASALTNEFDYDGNALLIRAVDRAGKEDSNLRITSLTYDGLDRCVKVTDALSNSVNYAYDRNGNLVYQRSDGELGDGPGDTGNVPLAETTCEYDPFNRLVRQTDFHFDCTTQSPIGDGAGVTTFAYAPNGQCTGMTDDNGHTTRYAYDTVGRLSSITDPKTNITSYAYEASGNILSATQTDRSDITGSSQQFTVIRGFDKLHRLTRSVDNVGNTNLYAYDSRDNLVRHTDPNGNLTGYSYDGLDRCTLAVADLNRDGSLDVAVDEQTTYEYDDNSRLHSQTDDNTNMTSYAYDSRDRCVSVTEADGTSRSLIWSPRSNLILDQDANRTVISNSFDLLDRCVRRDIAPGTGVAATTTFEMFTYDGLSRLVLASNDVSQVQFAYDSLDNYIHQEEDGLTTSYSYDATGNRLATTYPSGRIVTCTYDALDQVSSVSSSTKGPSVLLATYAYDGAGRLGRISRANNVNSRYQWDGLVNPANAADDFGWMQVSGVNHQLAGAATILDRRAATYDRNQNRLTRSQLESFSAGGTTTTNVWDYDPLNRLVQSALFRGNSVATKSYMLDGNGNRQLTFSNGLASAYTMDDTFPDPADFQMNQYTLTPFVALPELYDANGNLVSHTTDEKQLQYVYDYADRLVEIVDLTSGLPETLATYSYDAVGRRISKTVYPAPPLGPAETHFVYDGRAIIEERDAFGVVGTSFVLDGTRSQDDGVVRTFTWKQTSGPFTFSGRSGNLLMNSGGQDYYYLHDDLGNVLALTDAGGNVVERYDYDDFGAPSFLSADGFDLGTNASPSGNPYLFQSMEWDSESDFYHDPGGIQFMDKAQLVDLILKDRKGRVMSSYVSPLTGRYTSRNGGNNENWPFGGNQTMFAGNNPWSPRDHASGMPTGKRQHGPMRIAVRSGSFTDVAVGMPCPHVPRVVLKEFFETVAKPSQSQFGNLLDSHLNLMEDRDHVSGGGRIHLHAEGVIHRDIAARNILSAGDNGGMNSGFGIADRAEVRVDKFHVRQDFGPVQSNRRFQTLSHALKARHDVAMNSIRNMK